MRHVLSAFAAVSVMASTHLAAAAPSSCVAGDVRGLDPSASSLVVDFVCAAARAEVDRADTVGAFRVNAYRLDKTVSVRLDGDVAGRHESATLQLASLDELPLAAPRLASSVVRGQSPAASQRYDNLVDEDARDPRKKPSEGFWTGSLFVGAMAGHAAFVNGGGAGYRREGRDLALVLDMRFAWENEQRETRTDLFGLSLGGRALFGDRDIAPFAGGGLGYLWTDMSSPTANHEGSSVAPYVEGGVTFGRLSKFRLDLVVRADLPLQTAESRTYAVNASSGLPATKRDKTYLAPLTVGLTAAF